MYSAVVNSPETELAADISATDTTITVLDASKLAAAPNLFTIGADETAETVKYTGISGNKLTGCVRGFNGTAKAWVAGASVARYFTAADHEAFRENITDLDGRLESVKAIADTAETPAGAQAKADAAQAAAISAANTHSDGKIGDLSKLNTLDKSNAVSAVNDLYKSTVLASPNLIKNSTALLGLEGWIAQSDPSLGQWGYDINNPTTGGGFWTNSAVGSTDYKLLRSEDIHVNQGSSYHLQAMFATSDLPNDSRVYIEVVNAVAPYNIILTLLADPKRWWHRKAVTFVMPSGVSSVFVRLVVNNVPEGAGTSFARIKLAETPYDTPYSNEADAVVLSGIVNNLSAVIRRGTGSPEGVVTASVGTMYLRSDGATSTTLYIKTSGSGNTGWTAK
ncbi:hypothetical protein [Paenibacillus sp. CAA11]|uniref:hypothetical protein n=1 Tax=Paenibacillus sp. CAA11 TaxID=1532905 RepID=UPI00131F04F7|nr:hypothetical protein [Paenibacillus sp. CAA11]